MLTSLREWWRTPSAEFLTLQAQTHAIIDCIQGISQEQTIQAQNLVECIEALTKAQVKQAETFQAQTQQILNLWTQPVPERDEPLRPPRDRELLNDLQLAAQQGDSHASELLKPENQAQLQEYLSLFRES